MTVFHFVGGPLDGATAKRAAVPNGFSFVEVREGPTAGRFFARPGAARVLYRSNDDRLMFEGYRTALCGCGAFHERAWVDHCTVCGAVLPPP